MRDVTVVGAGPYGLSVAAHLRSKGVDHTTIGTPMESWLSKMPKGMLLKSAGFASNISDPEKGFTLKRYSVERGIEYADMDFPISLETFCAYGLAFKQHWVPDVEEEELVSLSPISGGFDLRTRRGLRIITRKVVVATGLNHFRYLPELLTALPPNLLSHAADVCDPRRFEGQRVAVIGSGASAVDIAVLLHEEGVRVQLISRKPAIIYSGRWGGSGAHPLLHRLALPVSGIGPGWKHRIFADLPWLFRYFPEDYRRSVAEAFPSPAGAEYMRDRAAKLPSLLGRSLRKVRITKDGVELHLSTLEGSDHVVEVDHIIAATGYKADVHRLPFISLALAEQLSLVGNAPRLSINFESSIPGLFFVGPASAKTFGPVMRFVFGTDYTSRTISRHLSGTPRTSRRRFLIRSVGERCRTGGAFSPEEAVDARHETREGS